MLYEVITSKTLEKKGKYRASNVSVRFLKISPDKKADELGDFLYNSCKEICIQENGA